MSAPIHIGLGQLALGLVFCLAVGVFSLLYALRLERDLLIGSIRTVVQLFALGYVLDLIFDLNHWALVLGVFAIMTFFAAQIIHGRVRHDRIRMFSPVLISMLISYTIITLLVVGVVVGARPWWTPQYFIPMAGMVIGNSMNAIALALDRLLGELREGRAQVELALCLGADYREASAPAVRRAMRAGMIPSINSMMAAGVVFIPGMMTGQILAGIDPLTAIRYQIVVMLMITGAAGLGTLMVVLLVRRRCFGPGEVPVLRPGTDGHGQPPAKKK